MYVFVWEGVGSRPKEVNEGSERLIQTLVVEMVSPFTDASISF